MPRWRAALERLAPDHADELGVLHEEPEAGGDDVVDLAPSPSRRRRSTAVLDPLGPLGQAALEHLGVQRVLRREVVQQARPADADGLGDVVERRAVDSRDRRSSGAPRRGSPRASRARVRLSPSRPGYRSARPGPLTRGYAGRSTVGALVRWLQPGRAARPGAGARRGGDRDAGASPPSSPRTATWSPTARWCPGLIDLQVNGHDDVDVGHARRRRLGPARPAAGRPRGHGLVPDARDRAARPLRRPAGPHRPRRRPDRAPAARDPGAHLEGPFLGGAAGRASHGLDRAGRPRRGSPRCPIGSPC